MKSIIKLIALSILSLLILSCSTMENDWKKAHKLDSISSYNTFITNHPDSKYIADAKTNIVRIAWQQATKINKKKSYELFLKTHPGSAYQKEAEEKIDELDWQSARQKNKYNAYEEYLKSHPDGLYQHKARVLAEEKYWHGSNKVNTLKAFQDYLQKYPTGKYQEQCKQRIEELTWRDATLPQVDGDKIAQYLTAYPKGKYALQAKDLQAYDQAYAKGTHRSFNDYLSSYPNGQLRQKAQLNMELISGRIPREIETILSESTDVIIIVLHKAIGRQLFGKIIPTKQHPFVIQLKENSKGKYQKMTYKHKGKEFVLTAHVNSNLHMTTAKTNRNVAAQNMAKNLNKNAPKNTTYAVAIEPAFNIQFGSIIFSGIVESSGFNIKPISGNIYYDEERLKTKIKQNSIFNVDSVSFIYQNGKFIHRSGLFR